ncbi:alpha/beta fold hydrolase [Marinicrinis lubricantis]|uniref:Alpha/beta fold hydrolase n=1 Tax=Marinicrinis lubricantis TaxID=2086470 RepID=A0ABW1IKT0_9BACL
MIRSMKLLWCTLILSVFAATLPVIPVQAEEYDPYEVVENIPVLFVHGYNDDGESWKNSEIYSYLQIQGSKVVSVDYGDYNRNDITSDKIQQIYSDAIAQLPKDSKFDIIVHSMGGLLTRYYFTEHPEIQDRVRRVIFIGTPHHGSHAALMNRLQGMIDDPGDYFEDGRNNQDIKEYRKLYQAYADSMFDSYSGGQISSQPYEVWLTENHPEVMETIKNRQLEEAGQGLEKLGTNVLAGSLDYRYSGAFEEYAKLLIGRILEREARTATYHTMFPKLNPQDDVSDENQIPDKSFVDEGTFWVEMKANCWGFCGDGQQFSAKNIVQDRLMLERFYLQNHIAEDGREVKESVVANLFLHRLWLDESYYRYSALNHNEYFPQYISIATVDDLDHFAGRKVVDMFTKNYSLWDNEEHDGVVPLSSAKLEVWPGLDPEENMDRNVQILPDQDMSSDRTVQKKSGNYIFHSDQMQQTDVLLQEYENPFTGEDDEDLLLKIDPNDASEISGRMAIVRVDSDYYGTELKLTIHAKGRANVRIAERDTYQTWDEMKPVPLTWSENNEWVGEYAFTPSEKVKDYFVFSDSEVTVSYLPPGEGEEIPKYPYYIQMLNTTLDGSTMKHQFRIIDRSTGKSVGDMRSKDFIVKLNDSSLLNPWLMVEKQTLTHSSSIVLNLDYSGSMNGWPKQLSQAAAYDFIRNLEGKTDAMVGVLGFTEEIKVLQQLTDQYGDASLTVYTNLDGGTALYDAVVAGANLLSEERGRKSMIVLSDGNDEDSRAELEDAIRIAKEEQISVYPIGLGDVDLDVLQQLADETGGKMLHTLSADDLSEIYDTVTKEEDYIYTLEYEAGDLSSENVLQLALTSDRSNEAKVSYGPLDIDLERWPWKKFSKMIEDIKEGYGSGNRDN